MADHTTYVVEFKLPPAHDTFIERVAERLELPLEAVVRAVIWVAFWEKFGREACQQVLADDPALIEAFLQQAGEPASTE